MEEEAEGSSRKAYAVMIVIRVIYTSMYIVSKVAFDGGMNTFVFIFYHQAVTGVSFYLQAWCIERKGRVFLAMSNPLGLVLTVLCSSFFLSEVVHLGSVLGGALLVAGLYSVLWGKSKEQAAPPTTNPNSALTTVKQQGCMEASNNDDDINNHEEEQKMKASPMHQV